MHTPTRILAPSLILATAFVFGPACDVDVADTGSDGVQRIIELARPESTLAVDDAARTDVCPDPDAPGVSYVAEDPEICAEISVLCLDGWEPIPPACGCGCYRSSPAAADAFVAHD